MAKMNLGKVSLTPKGAYDSATTYEYLDIVKHDGSSYIVLKTVTGVTPADGDNYMQVAQDGQRGPSGVFPLQELEFSPGRYIEPNIAYNLVVPEYHYNEMVTAFWLSGGGDTNQGYDNEWVVYLTQNNNVIVDAVFADENEGEVEWELGMAPKLALGKTTEFRIHKKGNKWFGVWF